MATNGPKYQLKDKKAALYRPLYETDDYGRSALAYLQALAPTAVWCYAKQLTQEQIFEAAHWGEKETRLFVFNYRKGLQMYDLILYRNEWYEITRVDTKDDYNGDLFVYVRKSDVYIPNDVKYLQYEENPPT